MAEANEELSRPEKVKLLALFANDSGKVEAVMELKDSSYATDVFKLWAAEKL